MKLHLKTLTVFLLLATLMACGNARVDPAYQALVEQEHLVPDSDELGVGDHFQIRVYNEEQLSGHYVVPSAGRINYPHIGAIQVLGKTCVDIETTIIEGLSNGYLNNPTVQCTITEYNSKRIYIFGQVAAPGSFPYRSNITIVEAIALAGGFSERANSNDTKLSRTIRDTEIQVRIPMQEIVEGRSRNIKLLPGDIIYVPQLRF